MTGWRGLALKIGLAGLYAGLFVSGIGLPLASAVPIGLAALVAYTVLMRPVAQWAGSATLLFGSLAVLAALSLIMAGLGSLARNLLSVPPWLGPAMMFGGVAVGRLGWSAAKADEMDAFLDQALDQLEGLAIDAEDETDPARSLDDLTDEQQATIQTVLSALDALPARPDDRTGWAYKLDAILDPLEDPEIWQQALDALSEPSDHPPRIEALAMFVLRPYVIRQYPGDPQVENAVMRALSFGDASIIQAMAFKAARTVSTTPDAWRSLPPSEVLGDHARRLGDDLAAPALLDLAEEIDRQAQADYDDPEDGDDTEANR